MDLLKQLVEITVSPLVPFVVKHMAYPFTASSNVKDLEQATGKLAALKEDVRTEITDAERRSGAPTNEVKWWLRQIDAIEEEAEKIREKHRQLCRCVWDITPNLWSSYKISKSAAKILQEVKSLSDEKERIKVIEERPPPLAQEMPASSSKSPYLELALNHINDDVHNIIGIWGMGGVGKTHLLKQINNKLSKESTFSVVVFVTCSKECSEEKIQNEIIKTLGLNGDGSSEQKQRRIHNFLSTKGFVLLLDDLWGRVDLEIIGIPNLQGNKKVVLTTRSTEVCGQMEVRKKIKVDVLNEDDAWSLFKEKVTEETINSDPQIRKCAVKVVKELGRLPLALIAVGRAMNDKMDPSEWEHAIQRLKQANLDDVESSGSDVSVFHKLKFSYDGLRNETLRQCFLHCALWPEDCRIEEIDLIHLWMGLGLIDEHDIQVAYTVGYSYIRRLQAVCLLEDASDITTNMVKMHDVIRDMALWIASNKGAEKYKWIVQAPTNEKHQVIEISHDTEKLSLMHSHVTKLSISIPSTSSKLSTLLLYNNSLEHSKSLQLVSFCALTVLDLSNNGLQTFPVEICKLVHLQSLNLSNNGKLNSLPEDFKALIKLKYLFLVNTNCTIPKGVLSELKALRVLNMCGKNIQDDSEIFTSLEEDIQCLPEFQALGITIVNILDFQNLSQTSKVPVRWLHIKDFDEGLSFTSCFLGNSQLQNNLNSLRILRNPGAADWVKFERTSGDNRICSLKNLETLSFDQVYSVREVVWKGLYPEDVFTRLKVLAFFNCINLKSISWIVRLPYIQEVRVEQCTKMEQLICIAELNNGGITTSQPAFPYLKKMLLSFCFSLESISDSAISFPSLEVLNIRYCMNLKKLPFGIGNPPKSFKLWCDEEWWNNVVEMEDSTYKSLLQPFFHKKYYTTTGNSTVFDVSAYT